VSRDVNEEGRRQAVVDNEDKRKKNGRDSRESVLGEV
jgi:hypothetical protein